ncbi:hypothetical protein UA08_04462 [Talaromyces atroroseus]|uniref:Uncharacterized protein n=1 Tax=Talaromyces atroroseus TaxID=1441469 RepID=A0A225AGL2_TALAT|nr:hypothetical protein UA08_04462 [Talaromyces atroroseus]OKL59830.1 hypothetical protein UA08_04462 [Talaromyces atroroseus]
MVSSKALLSVYALSDIILAYPIIERQHTEDSSSGGVHDMATRSPNPRFRNPFDVNQFLDNLDYKIPDNKDIQEWVDEVQKKGAMAAEGDFFGDDDDDDSDSDSDDNNEDEDDDTDDGKDKNKDKDDDDDEEETKKDHEVKEPTQSTEAQQPSTSTRASNTANITPLLPLFPTSTITTTIEMPTPCTTESPAQGTTTSEPEVSDVPMAQEPVSEDATSIITIPSVTILPILRPTYFTGLGHLLDLLPDDQSDASYRA